MVDSGGRLVPTGGRFADRRVVVTGAARGIGAEIARQFAGAGAHVTILDQL
ncbi:MAG: SDR family NAD(P)-dependent oxidoreductase, partial [Acidimicrobiales bacterium]